MTQDAKADKPNVLFVFSDQQRASAMGCYYGDEQLRTPNFDACAAEGVRLDTAISSTPVCTPYRAMLMTGKYGHHTGTTTNRIYPDLSAHHCIGKSFESAGYRCGYVGKWHLGEVRLNAGHPLRLGFDDFWFVGSNANHDYYEWSYVSSHEDEIRGEGFFRPQIDTDKAIGFIEEQDGQKPWFLMMSWGPPHSPFKAPDPYVEPYLDMELRQHPNTSRIPEGSPMRKRVDDAYPHYYGLTEGLDIEFGRLMKVLEEKGLAENTIVIYTSDHGEMLGSQGLNAKRWPYRESSQVPFIIRWPGNIEAGSSLSTPLGTADIFPTLCGMAGIEVPAGLDGRDCSGSIMGKSGPEQAYTYMTMHHAYVPWPGWRGVRTDRYSYARTEEDPWVLFDLENDPYEERNLIDENRDLATEIEGLLQEAMVGCGDSWREMGKEVGDSGAWLGPKQAGAQDGSAPYPGYDTFRRDADGNA